MLRELSIKKLFGRFDYAIKLHDKGITILTGPNGYGKSTILRMINALSTAEIALFFSIEFEKISFVFSDNSTFLIEQKKNDTEFPDLLINGRPFPINSLIPTRAHRVPWLHRVSPTEWLDYRTRERVTKSQFIFHLFDDENILQSFVESAEIPQEQIELCQSVISEIKEAAQKSGDVRFISEQRLLKKTDKVDDERNPPVVDVICELPQKMKAMISDLTADYSKAANSLDSTYPQRLLSTTEGLSGKVEFQKKLKIANDKFTKLSRYDLVDFHLIKTQNYTDEFSKALKIYFEDFEKKYSVFEKFIEKLDLFTNIINSRLTFKEIRVTRNDGLIVVDSDQERSLKLEQLSSGEKQEIVLFYDLIFGTQSDAFLLIDEPEISLHIMWQKKFMEDLFRIVELGHLNVLVATHSPQIINGRWDIQVDLGELYGG